MLAPYRGAGLAGIEPGRPGAAAQGHCAPSRQRPRSALRRAQELPGDPLWRQCLRGHAGWHRADQHAVQRLHGAGRAGAPSPARSDAAGDPQLRCRHQGSGGRAPARSHDGRSQPASHGRRHHSVAHGGPAHRKADPLLVRLHQQPDDGLAGGHPRRACGTGPGRHASRPRPWLDRGKPRRHSRPIALGLCRTVQRAVGRGRGPLPDALAHAAGPGMAWPGRTHYCRGGHAAGL